MVQASFFLSSLPPSVPEKQLLRASAKRLPFYNLGCNKSTMIIGRKLNCHLSKSGPRTAPQASTPAAIRETSFTVCHITRLAQLLSMPRIFLIGPETFLFIYLLIYLFIFQFNPPSSFYSTDFITVIRVAPCSIRKLHHLSTPRSPDHP